MVSKNMRKLLNYEKGITFFLEIQYIARISFLKGKHHYQNVNPDGNYII